MSDDMPWVIGLTDEEVQQLRKQKQELSQYGREKLRELQSKKFAGNYPGPLYAQHPDLIMTHEEMLEEAAKREAAMKAVEKLYDENGDALQQLAAIERQELIEQLEAKKKENFQLVADACMLEYSKKYNRDVFPVDEHWVYMVAEYFGTGEGQTTCIMMTQAMAGHKEDFEKSTNKYVPCTTKEYRAVRKFHEEFGTWMLHGLKFLSKEDFLTECAYFIPPVMMKMSNANCFKEFHTRVHYNFS